MDWPPDGTTIAAARATHAIPATTGPASGISENNAASTYATPPAIGILTSIVFVEYHLLAKLRPVSVRIGTA